jgi:hypothetical protein
LRSGLCTQQPIERGPIIFPFSYKRKPLCSVIILLIPRLLYLLLLRSCATTYDTLFASTTSTMADADPMVENEKKNQGIEDIASELGSAPKRSRHVDDDRLAVLDLLACVGDRAKTTDVVRDHIVKVVSALNQQLASGQNFREAFDSIGTGILRCGLELPYKSSVYGCIAGLLTARNMDSFGQDYGRKLGAAVSQDLSHALRDGQASKARRSLRFLAELAKACVISVNSLTSRVITILSAAETELSQPSRGANNVHARGEFLAAVALSVLPWCGSYLVTARRESLDIIMNLFASISASWKRGRWRAINTGDGSLAAECFEELLLVVSELSNSNWSTKPEILPAYCKYVQDELNSAPAVDLEPFALPAHSKLTRYAPPRFRLCLLSTPEKAEPKEQKDVIVKEEGVVANDAELLHDSTNPSACKPDPGTELSTAEPAESKEAQSADVTSSAHSSPSDRYILRQYVADVLDNFVSDHVKSAERLLTVPMLIAANDIIVESVFSELCAIPMPAHQAVYYGTVFVDLCKVKDSRLPIKLLTAVEKIFRDAGSLDPEVFDRLTEWFAFHLSNFEYKWNWSDWAVYADKDMEDRFPFQALFCRDVLDRSIRLSYLDRITKLLPPDMGFFLPKPAGNGNPLRFDNELNEQLVKIVAGAGKQPPSIVKDRLEVLLPDSSFDGNASEANLARLVALIRAILQGSSRTLSHFDTLVERYLSLLSAMASMGGIAARKAVALEAGAFWSASHLRCLYVLDKLSTYGVIDRLAVLDYIFSDHSVDDKGEWRPLEPDKLCARFEESPVWELARLVYSRARSRLDGARLELTAASGAASSATEGDAELVESRLSRAKLAAQTAKEEVRQLVLLGLRRVYALCDLIFKAQQVGLDGNGDGMDNELRLKMPNGKVFAWRALGMICEIGRKHPEQIESLLDDVRNETASARLSHPRLQEVFEILEEIAGCDIHPSAC